jgi:hypothetical protein
MRLTVSDRSQTEPKQIAVQMIPLSVGETTRMR